MTLIILFYICSRTPYPKPLKNLGKLSENTNFILPFLDASVSAGFPSPAAPFAEEDFNLNDLIDHPSCTYIFSLDGNSMEPTITDGAFLVVDCIREARHNDIILATLPDGETCKRLYQKNGKIYLIADNRNCENIFMEDGITMSIFGVVICHFVLHKK